MIKFTDIGQYRNAVRNISHKAQCIGYDPVTKDPIMDRLAKLPVLKYEGTVKIHGCNSSVRIEGSKFTPQSRNNELTLESDNYGFARFISELPKEDAVLETFRSAFGDNIVVFGEWAGRGIQDTVAVNQVDKFWAVFAIKKIIEDPDDEHWIDISSDESTQLISLLNKYRIYSIYQFGAEYVDVNFEQPAESINKINELSLKVEEECPAGKFFGIVGIGEGRVWRCVTPGYNSSRYTFKVKGQAHSKSKVKKLANVDVEKMKSIEEFIEKHVNEERLMQSWNWLAEMKKPQTEVSTGDFIRWIYNDILKEEADELAASGLTEKDLGGAVAKKARGWFFTKF